MQDLGHPTGPHLAQAHEQGMVTADRLSKTATKWELNQAFKTATEATLGLEIVFPDAADAKATLI